MNNKKYNVLITSYLEPEYVAEIAAVDERLNVINRPDLIPPPRYIADHNGSPDFKRSTEQEAQWQELLAQADILFDFDHSHRYDLPDLIPNVRWIQFTSSGVGAFVHNAKYDERLPHTVFTTASGVHAQPLAEFVLMVMLMFSNNLQRIQEYQEIKKWERFTGTDLLDSVLTIVGVGRVGRKIAHFAQAVGMRVNGVDIEAANMNIDELPIDALYHIDDLMGILPETNFLVLIAPHTPQTENMIGRDQLRALPQGAVVINVGRGSLMNEQELIDALQDGHLAGAGLDVFAKEPLPVDSPLWDMPNVLVSPHSGSTSDKENRRITNLFIENIKRFLAEKPLLNVLDTKKMY
ncbi:MAG: D-2-hydroxyacid dehydrogenase [Clostridia bacterium]